MMNIAYSRKLLTILIDNSSRILSAGFGVDRAESSFFEVIDLIKENPDLKKDFLMIVKGTLGKRDPSGLDEGSIPRELIELAVHELRWPEFEVLAKDRIRSKFNGDEELAGGDISDSILAAYEESWADRQFYRRYRS